MYGKIHQSLYTGSLLGSGPDVFAVWGWIIAHVVDGMVEINPTLLAMVIGKITPDEVCEVLLFLSRPDKNSRTQAEDGRRIVSVEPDAEILPGRALGYRVVNHALYRGFRTPVERREYMKTYMREKRAKKKAVNTVSNVTANVKHAEAEAYTETETKAEGNPPTPFAENSNAEMQSTTLGPPPIPVPVELERATVAAFDVWQISEDPKAKKIDPMTADDYPIRAMLSRLDPELRAQAPAAARWCAGQGKAFKNPKYAAATVESVIVEGWMEAPRKNGRAAQTSKPKPYVGAVRKDN